MTTSLSGYAVLCHGCGEGADGSPIASTSSKNMRQAFLLRAIWNSSRTIRAPCTAVGPAGAAAAPPPPPPPLTKGPSLGLMCTRNKQAALVASSAKPRTRARALLVRSSRTQQGPRAALLGSTFANHGRTKQRLLLSSVFARFRLAPSCCCWRLLLMITIHCAYDALC
jgi:hypothetical protein